MLSQSNFTFSASPQLQNKTLPSSTYKLLARISSEGLLVSQQDHVFQTVEAHKMLNQTIIEKINSIKRILTSIKGGEISPSPYDIAWVSLVEKISNDKENGPQFPKCLEWIANNQLQDGSWGVTNIFSAYDRLINTIACIVALKKWNLHPQKIQLGTLFIKKNFSLLRNENSDHMTIGFEILFPALVEIGRKLGIELPDDYDPIMKDIIAQKNLKLAKIPMEVLYKEHTTLHFSLEGIMDDMDWEKIATLQCPDGSMLFSPSATAYLFMKTRDIKSMNYLTQLVDFFDGAVPYIYPVDLFARNYAVDRLQCLGISHYFQTEIKECLNYVSRYWTDDKGCYTTSNTPFHDLDDTSVVFRNLRLNGYDVSPDAFWNYKHGDAFCCFPRQSSESVTALYNFYRACQLMFPGETVLEEGRKFAYKFLRERQANKQIVDKWLISKDLPGEVGYALDIPWYASLPRVETRFYIEQYGGKEDVWIGKCLYKMPEVNNDTYLELAKLDFNNCQDQHKMEWNHILEWYKKIEVEQACISERKLLFAYFLAAASIFEPEKSIARIAWAKSAILIQMVVNFFSGGEKAFEQQKAFVDEFIASKLSINGNGYYNYKASEGLLDILIGNLNQLSAAAQRAHPGTDIYEHSINIHQAWETWMLSWLEEGNSGQSEAELLVRTVVISSGGNMSINILSNPRYKRLVELLNRIRLQLVPQYHHPYKELHGEDGNIKDENITPVETESEMKELVQIVLQNTNDGIDPLIKQTFLTIAKTFYYTAYCSPSLADIHITKVLFEPVC